MFILYYIDTVHSHHSRTNSAVNMDIAFAIRMLEATYKTSVDAAAAETIILKLTEKVMLLLFC